jgi:hypothetical protein
MGEKPKIVARGALQALERAHQRAREDAKRWGTELVYSTPDGKVLLVDPNAEDGQG